ncbi:unnamed protein product [Effrenium voratum]|nr:unnamed protein product [Effrenium voratum]
MLRLSELAASSSGRQPLFQQLAVAAGTGSLLSISGYVGTAKLLGFGVTGVKAGTWAAAKISMTAKAPGGAIPLFSTAWWGQSLTGLGTAMYAKTTLGLIVPFLAYSTVLGAGAAGGWWLWKMRGERQKELILAAINNLGRAMDALECARPALNKCRLQSQVVASIVNAGRV